MYDFLDNHEHPRFRHNIWASGLPTQIRLVQTECCRKKSAKTDRRFAFPSTKHTKSIGVDRISVFSNIFVGDSSRPCNFSVVLKRRGPLPECTQSKKHIFGNTLEIDQCQSSALAILVKCSFQATFLPLKHQQGYDNQIDMSTYVGCLLA